MAYRQFDFYGVGVRIESAEEESLSAVEHDFSYFLGKADRPSLGLTLTNSKPDYDLLPELTCSFATPRNICFSDERFSYIDYFGQGLNIYDRQANHCEIITDDLELAHEIAYLTILSRVSEELERKHLHRIHGLGIEFEGKGTVILLPSGGGKSTMALSLLRYDDRFRLISEDSPLLRSDGQLLPFPLRIGVHPHVVPSHIDTRFTRLDKRIEFSSKINIDIRFFGNQVSRQAVPAASLLLGTRSTGRRARISPVSKTAALRHALTNSIIGVGLYQGLEFLSQKSFRESVQHMGLLFSRVYNNLMLLKQTRVYEFLIGRDIDRNLECLRDFLLQNRE
ncbi:MAG: hypothetical protein JW896_03735 [Deltaproteobacteria bacterium]|nr:hypothetical protein [Deltaproteobacteria bacterium]